MTILSYFVKRPVMLQVAYMAIAVHDDDEYLNECVDRDDAVLGQARCAVHGDGGWF